MSNIYEAFGNYEGTQDGQSVKVSNGKFTIRVPKGTPGSVDRIVEKTGKEVSELLRTTFNVQSINKFITEEEVWGVRVTYYVTGIDNQVYKLYFGLTDGYHSSMLKGLTAVNFEPSKPFKLVTYSFIGDNGKEKTGITVYQNENKMVCKFTNEELPAWKEVSLNGKKGFDKTDYINFLMENTKHIFNEVPPAVDTTHDNVAVNIADDDF